MVDEIVTDPDPEALYASLSGVDDPLMLIIA